MRKLLLALTFIALPSLVHAQPVPPAATAQSKFAIDVNAADLATAQGYVYKQYADGALQGTVIAFTCSGTAAPFLCVAPVGAFTPGQHSVTLTASNAAGESGKSAAIIFTMTVVPQIPGNPRILP